MLFQPSTLQRLIPHFLFLFGACLVHSCSVPSNKYTSTIYIDSDGANTAHCGTESCPCATIYHVTTNTTLLPRYNNYDTITIEIRGINFDYIENSQDCTMGQVSTQLTSNLVYYFNPNYIQTTQDWFDINSCFDWDLYNSSFWMSCTSDYTSLSDALIHDHAFLNSQQWQDKQLSISVEIENMIFENIDFYDVLLSYSQNFGDYNSSDSVTDDDDDDVEICSWMPFFKVSSSKHFGITNLTMNNITYGNILYDGWIGTTNLKIFNSQLMNITVFNTIDAAAYMNYDAEDDYFGFFGTSFDLFGGTNNHNEWHFENVVLQSLSFNVIDINNSNTITGYDNFYTPLFSFTTSSISSTNMIKMTNVQINSIDCGADGSIPIIYANGGGSGSNGVTFELTGVEIHDAVSVPFLQLVGTNTAYLEDIIYDTMNFERYYDVDDSEPYCAIITVDDTSSIELYDMEVAYYVMEDVFGFVSFDMEQMINATVINMDCGDSSVVDIQMSPIDVDIDYLLINKIGRLPRLVSNYGEMLFNNISITSDWNRTLFLQAVYDEIETNFNCSEIMSQDDQHCNQTYVICEYFELYDKDNFVEYLPLDIKYRQSDEYMDVIIENAASGTATVNGMYVDVGVNAIIFTNYGHFSLLNTTTYLFQQMLDNGFNSSIYDPYDLYPNMIGLNQGNYLLIQHGQLSGFAVYGILSTKGTTIINTTWISYTGIAAVVDDAVDQLDIYFSIFINVGRHYVSLNLWNTFGIDDTSNSESQSEWPPFVISAKNTIIEYCAFIFYDIYGMMRSIGSDFAATDEISLIIANTFFKINTNKIIWDLNIFEKSLNISNGNIIAPGFINVQEATFFEFYLNTAITNGLRNAPIIYFNVNDTRLSDMGCWSGNYLEDFALQVDSGTLQSCRLPNAPSFPSNSVNWTALLFGNGVNNLIEEFLDDGCWADFGAQREIHARTQLVNTDYNLSSQFSSIIINGIESYVVLDRADIGFKVIYDKSHAYVADLSVDEVWYPVSLISGKLSFVDVEFMGSNESFWSNWFNPNRGKLDIDFMLESGYNITNSDDGMSDHELIICGVVCLQLINGDPDKIPQMHAICDDNATVAKYGGKRVNEDEIWSLQNSSFLVASWVFSWSAEAVNYDISNEDSVYPGGWLQGFDFWLVDRDGTKVFDLDYTRDIEVTFWNDELNLEFTFLLTYDWNNFSYECDICEDGVYLQGATATSIGQNYTFEAALTGEESSLEINGFWMVFDDCPIGYGIDKQSSICEICGVDTVMLHSSAASCFDCAANVAGYADSNGVECLGADTIIVSLDYWVFAQNDTNDSYTIVYSECPAGYCCRKEAGCDYVQGLDGLESGNEDGNSYDNGQLCAENRDPLVPLCGACLDGYHELFATARCGKCEDPKTGLLIFPIIFSVWFVWFMVYFGKKPDRDGAKSWHIRRYQIRGYRKFIRRLSVKQTRQKTTANQEFVASTGSLRSKNLKNLPSFSPPLSPSKSGAIPAPFPKTASVDPDVQNMKDAFADNINVSADKNDSIPPTATLPPLQLTNITSVSAVSDMDAYDDGHGVDTQGTQQEFDPNDAMLHIGLSTNNLYEMNPSELQSLKTFDLSFKHHFRYESDMLRIMLFKNLAYYYQSLTYVLIQGGFRFYFAFMLDIFTLSFDSSNSSSSTDTGGFCLFKDINALQEIWYQLFVPALIFGLLLVSVILVALTPAKIRPKLACCGRKPSFNIAFWRSVLLCLGVILAVTFKLIACRVIDTFGVRMFYAGGNHCFGLEWYLSIIALIILIGSFVFIYIYLQRLSIAEISDPNNRFRTIVYSYKPNYWYWEFVVLSRRILVAFLATFQYIHRQWFNVMLWLIVGVYFGLQCYFRPFIYSECNLLEAIVLLFLMTVVTGVGLVDTSSTADSNILGIAVSVLIAIPFVIYLFYCVRLFVIYNRKIKPLQQKRLKNNLLNQQSNERGQYNGNGFKNDDDRKTKDLVEMGNRTDVNGCGNGADQTSRVGDDNDDNDDDDGDGLVEIRRKNTVVNIAHEDSESNSDVGATEYPTTIHDINRQVRRMRSKRDSTFI